MVDVFSFKDFASLMNAIKSTCKQALLAEILGVSSQKIHIIFKDSQHLVYTQVGKWRGALKLKRPEGDYFELLCIIHAYPYATNINQSRMLKRAFHLAKRLEEVINPSGKPAESVVYWLDPLVGVLREMVDLTDFPSEESEIPKWVAEKLTYLNTLGRLQKDIPLHIESTWNWLRKTKAVVYSDKEGRFVKSEPNILSAGRISPALTDISARIVALNHISAHNDFTHEIITPNVLGSKQVIVTLPEKALDLIDDISRDFLFGELMRKLNYVVNRDDRARLQQDDPDYYREIIEFEHTLIERGYNIPQCGDGDVDVTIQLMLSSRRLTKPHKNR